MIGLPNFDLTNQNGKQRFVEYVVNLMRNEIVAFTASYNDFEDESRSSLPDGLLVNNHRIGLDVNKPVAGDVTPGTYYTSTDVAGGTTYRSDGIAWVAVAAGVTPGNLTGDVTSVGLATSIAANVIVNADVNSAAGISYSKLNLAASITSSDIVDGTIVNADINASAAIDKTKISGTAVTIADTGTVTSTMLLDGTILNADVNAAAGIVDTKLATIATAGKVSNSATTATTANTASTIVLRSSNGYISNNILSGAIENVYLSAFGLNSSGPIASLTSEALVYYMGNATQNWETRITATGTVNALLAVGNSFTYVYLVTQGTTAYYQTGLYIDNVAVTPKWLNGSAPAAGNASSIDVYTLTIIKTAASTYTVLGSLVRWA